MMVTTRGCRSGAKVFVQAGGQTRLCRPRVLPVAGVIPLGLGIYALHQRSEFPSMSTAAGRLGLCNRGASGLRVVRGMAGNQWLGFETMAAGAARLHTAFLHSLTRPATRPTRGVFRGVNRVPRERLGPVNCCAPSSLLTSPVLVSSAQP